MSVVLELDRFTRSKGRTARREGEAKSPIQWLHWPRFHKHSSCVRLERAGLLGDYAELTKARITALIGMMAWSGCSFGAHKSGASSLVHALLGESGLEWMMANSVS